MERLNTKLYEKYRDIKKRKISEESERNAKVQAEFDKYLSVVEGMLEELQSENNQLRAQISSLEDSQFEYKQTLMEETRKGYSFSLTWRTRGGDEEEGQLFYHVSSLGTIERVALEWMKEDVVFSTAMSRTFFERISRVIGRPTTA